MHTNLGDLASQEHCWCCARQAAGLLLKLFHGRQRAWGETVASVVNTSQIRQAANAVHFHVQACYPFCCSLDGAVLNGPECRVPLRAPAAAALIQHPLQLQGPVKIFMVFALLGKNVSQCFLWIFSESRAQLSYPTSGYLDQVCALPQFANVVQDLKHQACQPGVQGHRGRRQMPW